MSDYIEREAAIKAFHDKYGALCTQDALFAILMTLEEVPAADVVPVVRGKWEDVHVRDYSTNINGGINLSVASMFCPACNRWHNEVYHYGNPTETVHYCPNCGARMDGDGE